MSVAVCAAHRYRAIDVVYATRGAARFGKVVVLTAAVAGILRGHHFVVCVITLHAV